MELNFSANQIARFEISESEKNGRIFRNVPKSNRGESFYHKMKDEFNHIEFSLSQQTFTESLFPRTDN